MKNWQKNLIYNLIFLIIIFMLPFFVLKYLIKSDYSITLYIGIVVFEFAWLGVSYVYFELKLRGYYKNVSEKIRKGNIIYNIENKEDKKFIAIDTLLNFEYFISEELDKIFHKLDQDKKLIDKLEQENYTKYHVKEYQLKSAVTELEKMNDRLKKKEDLLDNFIELIENIDNINTTYDMFFEEILYHLESLMKIKDAIVVKKQDEGYDVFSKISNEFNLTPRIISELEKLDEKVYHKTPINRLTGYDIILHMKTNKMSHGFLLINGFSSQYLEYPVYMKIVNTMGYELANIADNLFFIESLKDEIKKLKDDKEVLKEELELSQSSLEMQLMQMTSMYEEIVTLYEAGKSLGKIVDIRKSEIVTLEMILDIVEAEFGAIFYYNSKGNPNISRVIFKDEAIDENIIRKLKIGARDSTIFYDLKEKESEIVINNFAETKYFSEISIDLREKVVNFLEVPIYQGKQIIGGVAIFNKFEDFTAGNINLTTALTNQLGMSLQNIDYLNKEIERKREEEMLKIASQIQSKLFPQAMPELNNYSFFGTNVTAKAVGGDYYDLVKIDEDNLIGVIADVSGKGIPAALLVSMFRTIFRMLVEHFKEYSPDKLLYSLNNILSKEDMEGRFITAICFKVDSKEQTVEFANAGHDPVLVYNSEKEMIEEYDLEGTILGFMEDEEYEKTKIKINKNDIMVFYTDGVVEARSSSGEFFEFDRLREVIIENNKYPPDYIVRKLQRTIDKFLDGSQQNDDITVITLKGV